MNYILLCELKIAVSMRKCWYKMSWYECEMCPLSCKLRCPSVPSPVLWGVPVSPLLYCEVSQCPLSCTVRCPIVPIAVACLIPLLFYCTPIVAVRWSFYPNCSLENWENKNAKSLIRQLLKVLNNFLNVLKNLTTFT